MDYNQSFNKLLVLAISLYLFFGVNNIFAGQIENKSKNFSTEAKKIKKRSSATFYGRLWIQYDNTDEETGSNDMKSSLRDNEGMGRFGIKGKESIGNGYTVNYKIEYAIDLGDGIATSDSTTCSRDNVSGSKKDCQTFLLKQGWIGFLTPIGQFKFGSMESPYKYLAKHDILHDTISQARDTRMISQGSMSHSSYWRESMQYELKSGNLRFAAIYGIGESSNNSVTNKDSGLGIEYKNFLIPNFSVVYARNHDDSADEENTKYTITYDMKLDGKKKIKVWYMHEDVELDTKLFTTSGNGEVDWYGIRYSSGPMTLQYSYADAKHDDASNKDRDGYNIGMTYKLSKQSRLYVGHSDSEAGSGDGTNQDISSTMLGIRHDF
ncbi:MAG: hypothetical protein CMD88_00775 [Gammaproteobacteria bacterium]|nr:hypothetical protein [Gammaproteobacteria bacterium]|tara:strand:+ start:1853 stop:2989 length:1137 start_codon:yes stop_codon:yes gene_type:complete